MAEAKRIFRSKNAASNNRRVALFFRKRSAPSELRMSEPGDSHEREADTMADHVMRMSDPATDQHAFFKPAASAIQRKNSQVGSLQSSGQPLPETSRKFFEPRFGTDLSDVRIHTGAVAAKSAESMNALAYTTGNNIVFNEGQYAPGTESGNRLLAHELSHVTLHNKPGLISRQSVTTPNTHKGTPQKQGGFSLQLSYINITVLPDVLNSPKELPHVAHTYLSKPTINIPDLNAKLDTKTNLVASFDPYPALQISLTVETNYGKDVIPTGPSDYGYGTRPEDKKAKNTSIMFHEGSHGSLFIDYIAKEISKYPAPQFEGKTGMTQDDFLKKVNEYLDKVGAINQMILTAIRNAEVTVDCAGAVTIDQHNKGRQGYVNICP